MSEPAADCIIVGGGLAGLACARTLHAAGRRLLLLEASERLGGRVATESVEGFRIDRGFQVYLDAYPEGRRQLDHASLELGRFEPGAILAEGPRLRRLADPWRRPLAAVGSLVDGTVGLADALRIASLRGELVRKLRAGSLDPKRAVADERSTREMLLARGFSEGFIRRFFEPFFGGVFLERELATSEAVFAFSFAMFSVGSACLPAGGMQAIPRQLAAGLPAEAIRVATPVAAVEPGRVRLADGGELTAEAVVVATDAAAAGRILPAAAAGEAGDPGGRAWKATRLVAFRAERSPLGGPTLLVVADEPGAAAASSGPISNLTVPSDVAAGYAPPGVSLVAVSVREDWQEAGEPLADAIRRQASAWFGETALGWQTLAEIEVPHALPVETPQARRERPAESLSGNRLFLCGDHLTTASINGALGSGRRCGEAVAAALSAASGR